MVTKVDGSFKQVIESKYTARQQTPEVYDMNASIYVYKADFVEQGTAIFKGKCGITLMEDQGVIDLDTERDFELMEVIAQYLVRTNPDYKKLFDTALTLRN
jgi:CMP-N,N'-diacetyllegionaminic acid synthase